MHNNRTNKDNDINDKLNSTDYLEQNKDRFGQVKKIEDDKKLPHKQNNRPMQI